MRYVNRGLRLILALSCWLALASITQTSARADGPNQVGLVVDFGNGSLTTRCIAFEEAEISGYDVLRRSGLSLVVQEVSGMGVTICDIEGTSECSASNCFCQCQGMDCLYWRYYYLSNDSWQYAPMGAAARTVGHGDVEGWAWGEENASGGPLPLIPFDQICPTDDATSRADPPASPTATPLADTATPTAAEVVATPTPSSPSLSPTSGATATYAEPGDRSPTDATGPPFPSHAAGYAAFAVIALGLLGWLIFVTRGRR